MKVEEASPKQQTRGVFLGTTIKSRSGMGNRTGMNLASRFNSRADLAPTSSRRHKRQFVEFSDGDLEVCLETIEQRRASQLPPKLSSFN